MTSNIGIDLKHREQGVHLLPDGSIRYCFTRTQIYEVLSQYILKLEGAVKTVKVEEVRTMTTFVIMK